MRDTSDNTQNDRPLPVGFVGRVDEYHDALAPFVNKGQIEIRDYPDARSVLRLAVEWNALWLIDIELPDMSGLDLFEMIRERLRESTVCMIGSLYRQADEVRAYRAGATIYASRPLKAEWLQSCIELLLGDRKPHGVVGFNDPSSAEDGQIRRKNGKRITIKLCGSNNNGH